MVKKEDMIKVLLGEIIKLEDKITSLAEMSMRKLKRIENRLHSNNHRNEHHIKFVKENQEKITSTRSKLDIFYKMFKIIDEGENNDTPTSKSNRGKDTTVV